MKVEAAILKNRFEPVMLTITLETQGELNAIYAMLSHSRIYEPLDFQMQANVICTEIRRCVCFINDDEAFSKLDKSLLDYKD